MRQVDYLIIGGGAAGTNAAESIRAADQQGSVLIVQEENHLLYSRVQLPHFLRKEIPRERVFLRSEADYLQKKIELLKGVRVVSVDTREKIIGLTTGEEVNYSKLLIASGGKVNKLTLPGANLPEVVYLRTINDTDQILRHMDSAKQGVVVGAGFIGIEFIQSFVRHGLKTISIIREPYFWDSVVGERSGRLITKILVGHGVGVLANSQIKEFMGNSKLENVVLADGREIPSQIAGIGVGIQMDLEYLKTSAVKINRGVVANEYLESETQDVWVAGDIAEFYDPIFDKSHQLGNWSNAAAQGRLVGTNMVKGYGSTDRQAFETVSMYKIDIFEIPFSFLGDPVVDKETEVIEREDTGSNQLGRLHLKNGVLTGASLIGFATERTAISELIKSKVRLNVTKDKLSDPFFDLNQLRPQS